MFILGPTMSLLPSYLQRAFRAEVAFPFPFLISPWVTGSQNFFCKCLSFKNTNLFKPMPYLEEIWVKKNNQKESTFLFGHVTGAEAQKPICTLPPPGHLLSISWSRLDTALIEMTGRRFGAGGGQGWGTGLTHRFRFWEPLFTGLFEKESCGFGEKKNEALRYADHK